MHHASSKMNSITLLGNDPSIITSYSLATVTTGAVLGGVAYGYINPYIEYTPGVLMSLGYSYSNYIPTYIPYIFLIPATIGIEIYTELLSPGGVFKEGVRSGIIFSVGTLVYDCVISPLYTEYQKPIEIYEEGNQSPILGLFVEDQCRI